MTMTILQYDNIINLIVICEALMYKLLVFFHYFSTLLAPYWLPVMAARVGLRLISSSNSSCPRAFHEI